MILRSHVVHTNARKNCVSRINHEKLKKQEQARKNGVEKQVRQIKKSQWVKIYNCLNDKLPELEVTRLYAKGYKAVYAKYNELKTRAPRISRTPTKARVSRSESGSSERRSQRLPKRSNPPR